MSTSNQMAESLLEAMRTLVDKSVAEAGFDKTVEAQIVSYEDNKAGKYKIKYQGEYFYAYSDNTETVYKEGTTVYVLFPGNSKTKQKTIVGSVKNLGTTYVSVLSDSDKYVDIGTDIVINYNTDGYELCSYKPEEIVLYEYDKSSGKISIDQQKVKEYLSEADAIRIKADFKTSLPVEQQTRGNYGVSIFASFKSDINKETPLLKEYKIDVNSMSGNPYALTEFTTQEILQDLDADHFIRIEKIIFYANSFPNSADGKDNDIFLKNFEIYLTNALSDEELNGYYLKLVATRGTTITEIMSQQGKSLPIEMRPLLKGQEITSSSEHEYYWFIKNPSVAPNDLNYHQKGGLGWQCLNEFQVTEREDPDDEKSKILAGVFQPGKSTFSIGTDIAVTYRTEFKCVAIIDGTTLSKEFVIFNDDCNYSFSLFSPSKSADIHKKTEADVVSVANLDDVEFQEYLTIYNKVINDNISLSDKFSDMENLNNTYEETVVEFINDIGNTELVCSFADIDASQLNNIHFTWSVTDINGKTTIYKEDEELINDINTVLANITTYQNVIKAGKAGTITEAKENLAAAQLSLKTLRSKLHVEKNRLFPISATLVKNVSTFSCGIYDNTGLMLGSASVKISNTEAVADYTLIINDGTQVFQYTEAGIAPNSSTLKNPMTLTSLSFDIIDKYGNKFDDDTKIASNITWSVPTTNTLLTYPKDKTSVIITEDGYAIFKDMLNFDYGIASSYKVNCLNQNIQLTVTFKGQTLTAQTNFSFIKTGEPGSNGTDFIAKLIPNKTFLHSQDLIRDDYILLKKIRRASSSVVEANTYSLDNGIWALPELYHNGSLIFNETSSGTSIEGEEVTVQWSILKNKYAYGVEDFQPFSIDSSTGEITINEADMTGQNMNILNTYGLSVDSWLTTFNTKVSTTKTQYEADELLVTNCNNRIKELNTLINQPGTSEVKKQEYRIELTQKENELKTLIINKNNSKKDYNNAVLELESYEAFLTNDVSSSLATLIKVTMTYKKIEYSDIIPVMIVDIMADTIPLNIELDNGGFLYGMYSSDGRRTSYDTSAPFTLKGKYGFDEVKADDIETLKIQSGEKVKQNKFSIAWDTIGTVAEKKNNKWEWITKCSLEEQKISSEAAAQLPFTKKWIKPTDTFDGQCVTNMVRAVVKDEEEDKIAAVCYIPVYLLLNKYGNAAINGWDGNGIELNEDSGVILAPQVGAGRKEDDNSFTGVIIGTENVAGTEAIGLLGYSKGERTIFLDAESGKAEFGKNNGGKIIIDPTQDKALLYSGNYKDTGPDAGGMLIDLTTPEIKFGTGNFTVNAAGDLTAKTGQIGGWDIGTNQLTSCEGKVGMRSYDKDSEEKGKQYAFWAGNTDPAAANFRVQYDGSTVVDNLRVASTDKNGNRVVIDNGAVYSEKKDGDTYISHDSYANDKEGFYIGADGFSVGGSEEENEVDGENEFRGFRVSSKGDIEATSGLIGGWKLTEKGLSAGKVSLNDTSEGIFICKDGIVFGDPLNTDGTRKDKKDETRKNVFSVNSAGELYSITGLIGGWSITADTLSQKDGNANVGLSSKCYNINDDGTTTENLALPSIWSGSDTGHSLGPSGGTVKGPKFFVDFQGNVYAKEAHIDGTITSGNGTIGGWTIGGTTLSASGITISSNGAITGKNWKINADGNSYFNNITCYGTFTGGSTAAGADGGTLSSNGYTGNAQSKKGTSTFDDDGVLGAKGGTFGCITISGTEGHSWGTTGEIHSTATIYFKCDGGDLTIGDNMVSSADMIQTNQLFKQIGSAENKFPGGISTGNITCKVITCSEPKPRTIKTNNYGDRLLIAYETTECLFGDCGTGVIGEDGKCYITIDPIFAETTENYNNVKVLLTKYGEGDIYFDAKNSINNLYLIIKGTPGLEFCWEWRLPQKRYGNTEKLQSFDRMFNNSINKYNIDYSQDIQLGLITQREKGGFI